MAAVRELSEYPTSGMDPAAVRGFRDWRELQYIENNYRAKGSFLRPYFSSIQAEDGENNVGFVLCIPYIHWEFMTDYVDAERPDGMRFPPSSDALLPRRTLDEAYYHMLPTVESLQRNWDQVVSRYIERANLERRGAETRRPRGPSEIRQQADMRPKLLMVDQLWLWVVGEKLVISAFPRRCCHRAQISQLRLLVPPEDGGPVDQSDVLYRVHEGFRKDRQHGSSVFDLADLIIQECTGLLFSEPRPALDFLSFFDESIRLIARKETEDFNAILQDSVKMDILLQRKDSFTRMPAWKRAIQAKYPGKESLDKSLAHPLYTWQSLEALRAQFDLNYAQLSLHEIESRIHTLISGLIGITREMERLREIKGILDELDILESNTQDQLKACWMFENFLSTTGRRVSRQQALTREVEDGYRQLNLLKAKAGTVERAQQTSVLEAYSTLQQAEETQRQGNTLLVFTLVTIFFAPLSFIAAVFSMQADELASRWPISRIMAVMWPTSIATFIVIVALGFSGSPFALPVVRSHSGSQHGRTTKVLAGAIHRIIPPADLDKKLAAC
ncbi:uncharacterized protein BJX67DRAFT_383438 [Aspergillus lucknowensis]|uniref:Uncharacterized protein n=1 Tax=Aspergillus lucknowensis TaxID=176173 RepID=A0ABR4LJY8_9EURO